MHERGLTMKHLQAFVTPSSLESLLQELRAVPHMPEIETGHQRDGCGQEDTALRAALPDELVSLVVGIIRSHSDCLVIVAPQGWMNNEEHRIDFAQVMEVLSLRFGGALHGRADDHCETASFSRRGSL